MGGMATIGALTFKTRGRRTPVGISSRTKVAAFDDFLGTAGAAPPPQSGVSIMGTTQLAPPVNQVWVTYAEDEETRR